MALLENGALSVAKSLIARARAAVDKSMEEGYMKFANSPSKYKYSSKMYLPCMI